MCSSDLKRVMAQVDRAAGLIGQLSRFAAGDGRVEETQPCSLQETLGNARNLIGPSLDHASIQLDERIAPDASPFVQADPVALEQTVARWNASCAGGADGEFGRKLMLNPIAQAPFYALELSPSMLNTQGGPRRNEHARIVRPDGSEIPRLYSAGELGSIYSYLYQGTGNLGECLAFGRIAGRNAAAETPWG